MGNRESFFFGKTQGNSQTGRQCPNWFVKPQSDGMVCNPTLKDFKWSFLDWTKPAVCFVLAVVRVWTGGGKKPNRDLAGSLTIMLASPDLPKVEAKTHGLLDQILAQFCPHVFCQWIFKCALSYHTAKKKCATRRCNFLHIFGFQISTSRTMKSSLPLPTVTLLFLPASIDVVFCIASFQFWRSVRTWDWVGHLACPSSLSSWSCSGLVSRLSPRENENWDARQNSHTSQVPPNVL